MEWFFDFFGFFATGFGSVMTVSVAILMILLWDWRFALVGLFVIQLSLATLAVQVFSIPVPWATAHVTTTLLCCLMLAISMGQISGSRSLHQAGNGLLRIVAIVILFFCWRLIQIEVALPLLTMPQLRYLMALIIAAVALLSLSDSPLFTSIGLLFWMVIMQLVIEIYLPIPSVLALMGVIQLVLALTGSYLMLADRVPLGATQVITSDITFPDAVAPVLMVDVDDSIDTPALPILPSRLLVQKSSPSQTGEHEIVPKDRPSN